MTLHRSIILIVSFFGMLIIYSITPLNNAVSKYKTPGIVHENNIQFSNVMAEDKISSGCDIGWTQQTSGISADLISVSTVSQLIGWAAGANGRVIRTIDGTAWTNANPNPGIINGDIYNIHAWSANDALCTTSPNGTFIYKTTNGGLSWTQVYTHPSGFINAIAMISPTEGYATGDPIGLVWEFLKTTNGGTTWTQVPTAPSASDNETGWNNSFQILGNKIWWGSTSTKVYYSTNLGAKWLTGLTIGTANSMAIHFNNNLDGMAGGSNVVLSTNGGASYNNTSSPLLFGDITGLAGAGTDWWALQSSSAIYRSTNNGGNWSLAFNAGGTILRHIDIKEIGGCPMGWAVGDGGGVIRIGTTTSVISDPGKVPENFLLYQNYPNPFNPVTNIKFSVSEKSFVNIKIFDISGKEIAVLISKHLDAGNYAASFDASALSSGIYFYQMSAGNFISVKKMTVLK